MSLAGEIGGFLLSRTSRRGFLAKATVTATALSVAPVELLTRPGTAYGAICSCAGNNCNCTDLCCDGYTQFCCTINNGVNACPPGTFAGGWWKADGSQYCAGPRYYIDCMGECQGCGCGGGNFCPGCDNLSCECALGACGNRHVGCTEFRYGQCHQEIGCSGRISCRVVSCTAPWLLDATCSTVAQTDDATANHFAPCQDGPTTYSSNVAGMAVTATGKGYWLVDQAGGIKIFGDAVTYGSLAGVALAQPVVGMESTPDGKGYWLVAADGGIFAFGDAPFEGSTGSIRLNRPIVGMSVDDQSDGYRFVAADGGVFDFNAPFEGSLGNIRLTRPVVGMAATKSGAGYWLVASDGGIFAFGDAGFHGSMGGSPLAQPIVGMAATPSGQGYWLVASDGGIFTFGDAVFHGSLGAIRLARPIVGMAATPSGQGYWLVASDGGIFTFGDAVFLGSGA
ncbi:MAG: hypothetical protein JO337_11090 [Acidimicrobiales bacterium]|nr:hypothetical protein [Acidimicrobiales bacterium]